MEKNLVNTVSTLSDFNNYLKTNEDVIVCFYENSTLDFNPSNKLLNLYEKYAFSRPSLCFLKINIDNSEEIIENHKLEILALPTIFTFRKEKIINTYIGDQKIHHIQNFKEI